MCTYVYYINICIYMHLIRIVDDISVCLYIITIMYIR